MRYYSINIEDAPAQFGLGQSAGGATYTSYVNGQTLPGAWQVGLDIPVTDAATPMGGAYVQVSGVSLAEVGQAANLVNKKIKVYGGMQKGFPLANPRQAGLLVQGYIFQAWGNWIGTDQTLEMIIQPGDPPATSAQGGVKPSGGTGSYDRPINLVLNWKQGQTLGTAIETTLKTAFPGFTVSVAASDKLVRPADEVAIFQTLTQLGQWAKQMSLSIIKEENYAGLKLAMVGPQISVFDGTQSSDAVRQIEFTDLIGQPTWIEAPNIQVKCVMRADIKVGGKIKLPQTSVINTAQALSSLLPNQRLTFQGEFLVVSVRHLGSFRQADAASWVTIINAAPTQIGGAAGG